MEEDLYFVDEMLVRPTFSWTPEDFVEEGNSLQDIEDAWNYLLRTE